MHDAEAPNPGDLVAIRTCRDNLEADILRSILTEAGIRCFVQGEHHRGMLGVMGAYIDLRLMVCERDEPRAREILQGAEESLQRSLAESKNESDSADESEGSEHPSDDNVVFRVCPKLQARSPVPAGIALLLGGFLFLSGQAGFGAVLILLGAVLLLGNRQLAGKRGGRCSTPSCQTFIPRQASTCPGCGGRVAGDIEHADQRLQALEDLAETEAVPGPASDELPADKK